MTLQYSPSKNKEKFGQAQMIVQVYMLSISAVFCLFAAILDTPVMQPEMYGELVTSVKAEYWSWPLFLNSMVYILGLLINGHWRWSPSLRLFGATVHAFVLTLFTYLSSDVGVFNSFAVITGVGALIHLWFVSLNLGDLYRAIKGRNRWKKS